MGDYLPVDLTKICNVGLDSIDTRRAPPVGGQVFHGIPFLITDTEPCFALLTPNAAAINLPIGQPADHLIVAHRRLREDDSKREPMPGAVVAEYAFHLANGTNHRVPIRERLEIAAVADEGWDSSGPFHAAGTSSLVLLDRHQGPWQDAGVRQQETTYQGLADYFLWVWKNPTPAVPIDRAELSAHSASVLVAAITLGNAEEHPFAREAARTVRITRIGQPLTDPAVQVDRGIASYAYRLPSDDADPPLDDPLKGWGYEEVDADSPHAYVRMTAVPSASVQVADGDQTVGRFRWGDLTHDQTVDADGMHVEVVEQGRNWVHVTVLDDDTDRPVPCRVHFRSPEGVPYQPHGHHDHVNSDLGTWHIDVGGDVRLGSASYAYIDGTCQGWLPRGEVLVDVARGFEYEPLRQRVQIAPGQRELELRLKRWTSMNSSGWYSGDSHAHFLSTPGSLLEQQGEDLNVVNLLQSQWGSLFTNTEDFTGTLASAADGRYVTWVGQENRQPFFGHLVLWGLTRPVMPWCTDGPIEAELGAWQETTLSDWADRCHEQSGTVVIPHFPLPNGEPAALIATGRADAIEMIVQWPAFHLEYYGYLNAGYRLPLVGGTDKMSADVTVGAYRTYAKLDDEFSYDGWRQAVRAGRTFLSGGPMLWFEVDGQEAGDTVATSGPGTVSVSARAESIFPIGSLQVVCNGEVVASTEGGSDARRLELQAEVRVDSDSWLAARCGGPNYFDAPAHRGPWERGIFAHTSPVYVSCGPGEWSRFDPDWARRMLTLIDNGMERLDTGRHYPEDRITHHHGQADHLAFLQQPFREARDRVLARLRDEAT